MSQSPANLIVRPEKLGDLIVATPVFRAFKESFPDQPLHLLTDEVFADAVRHDPHLDKIITIRWKGRERSQREPWWSIYRKLSVHRYERAALFYYNVEMWNWLLAALRVPHVAQLGGTYSSCLLGHKRVMRRDGPASKHYVDWYLDVAQRLGARTVDSLPRLYVTPREEEILLSRFPSLRRENCVLIHVFSLTVYANLSPAAYLSLARHLARQSEFKPYLIGTAQEWQASGLTAPPDVSTELIGQLDLRELMASCKQARAVIGGSSGIVHLAAAMGTPTLGVYCPSHEHHLAWGPKGPRSRVLLAPARLCRRLGAVDSGCQAPAFCDLSFSLSNDAILEALRQLPEPARG